MEDILALGGGGAVMRFMVIFAGVGLDVALTCNGMIVSELVNIILRLQMASKESESDIVFDSGDERSDPFGITGVHMDEDGDVCLECDDRVDRKLPPQEIAAALSEFDGGRDLYFLHTDRSGENVLYNIKDGGTKDRSAVECMLAGKLIEALRTFNPDDIIHFETGTINFTINSVYLDDRGCLCLESNEIEELDNYPVGMIVEELQAVDPETMVYFYDDESKEFYGFLPDDWRYGKDGGPWMKIR